ncbi:MAG TPA: hypothetical protein VFE84_03345, partial [Patescibacteria group bacterium]|nr:hypothetical protein [Patescibacteria group bacterium]
MFCWQARRGFAGTLDGTAASTDAALQRHLGGCAGCTAELEKLRRLRSLLSDAARISAPPTQSVAFEDRILRLARARAAAVGSPSLPALPGVLPGALPVAAAFSLMVAAVVLSHLFSGGLPAGGPDT